MLSMAAFFIFTPIYASDAIETESDLRFRHLTVRDGLSLNTVVKMVQDPHGFIWVATNDGLNRYDGYEFVVYKRQHNNEGSLRSNYISALHIDKTGILWVGTRAGLHRYNEKTDDFSHFPLESGDVIEDLIFSIIDDNDEDHIWIATLGSGISRFNKKSHQFKRYLHDKNKPKSISDNSVYKLFRDSKNRLWLGNKHQGLSLYQPEIDGFKHFTPQAYPDLKHGRVYDILEDSENQLWLGTRGGGLCQFIPEQERFTCYQHNIDQPESLADDHVYSLALDNDNRIWVGTMPGGLHIFNPSKKSFLHYRYNPSLKDGISSDSIYSIFVDNTGLIWIGTFGFGINIINPSNKQFGFVPPEPARKGRLNNGAIFELIKDKDNRTWVGTNNGGINVIENGQVVRYFKYDEHNPNSLRSNYPTSMYLDKNNDIWVGTENGYLHRYRPETEDFEIYSNVENDPHSFIKTDRVKVLLEDGMNNFWIGTHDGLVRFDREANKFYTYQHDDNDPTSLSSSLISSLSIDLTGKLWIGTGNGLNRYDYKNDAFIRHAQEESICPLNDQFIYDIHIDKQGIWVATSNGGLNKYNPESSKIEYFTEAQGLSNNNVYSILPSDNDTLWLSTNNGLSLFTPATKSFNNYYQRHGLQNNEFNQSAAIKAKDGSLLFGGINGYNEFQPSKISYDLTDASPVVTSLYISNERQQIQLDNTILKQSLITGGEIELGYEQSNFSLEFSALHFMSPDNNNFSYFLEGFDDEWIYTNARNRRATYTKIPAGSYLFRLKASNGDNIWSDKEYQLRITILPPWWLTWWAKTLAIILVAGLLFVIYWWRIRYFKLQQSLLETLVLERTETINLQKQKLETSYESIALLSKIGLEVTSTLDLETILQSLFGNINAIFGATNFAIGIYDQEKQEIKYDLVIYEGKRYTPYIRTMHETGQFPVWCIQNKQSILIKDAILEAQKYFNDKYMGDIKAHFVVEPETYEPITKSLSMIYVPLLVNNRILGVLSVQSEQKNAFDSVHVNMMTTLATYTANALENATMYAKLQQAQDQLIESKKMASIANLVAGVSHEVNTPLGIGITAASHLQNELIKLATSHKDKSLSQTKFTKFISESESGFTLLLNSLSRCSDLISSLKNIVVMHTAGDIDDFDVSDVINKAIKLHDALLSERNIEVTLNLLTNAPARTYPKSIDKILNALLKNSLEHAFSKMRNIQDCISINLKRQGQQYLIEYQDNGCGLSLQQQEAILEPFTTSKRGQGSVGLGMYAVYSQIKQRLQGTIEISSEEGKGMKVSILLPARITNESENSASG